MVPKTFYVTEKAWNYYPFTITEYSCSFLTCAVNILTKYENNNGSTENCLNASKEVLEQLTVDHVDIAMDQCAPHHFKVIIIKLSDSKMRISLSGGGGPLEVQE